jgi:hypothetical protein
MGAANDCDGLFCGLHHHNDCLAGVPRLGSHFRAELADRLSRIQVLHDLGCFDRYTADHSPKSEVDFQRDDHRSLPIFFVHVSRDDTSARMAATRADFQLILEASVVQRRMEPVHQRPLTDRTDLRLTKERAPAA